MDKGLRQLLKQKKYFQRLKKRTSWGFLIKDTNGEWKKAKWFELIGLNQCNAYKTTGTPCSCWICSCDKYNRNETKKELKQILNRDL